MRARNVDPPAPGDLLTALPGIGEKRAMLLSKLGLRTVEDVLRNAPRGYEDRGDVIPATGVPARAGEFAVVRGRIAKAWMRRGQGGRAVLRARIEDPSGAVDALWFGAAFLAREIREGVFVALSGRVSADGALLQPEFVRLPAASGEVPDRLRGCRPLYALTEGLSQRLLRDLAQAALAAAGSVVDPLPADVREAAAVGELAGAMRAAHAPRDLAEGERGRERLLFDALLSIELAVRRRLRVRLARRAPRADGLGGGAAVFVRGLPFRLTPSQEAAIADACEDLQAPHPMGRMVVGEVGCGKTAVALAVIEEARSRGLHCALLAPTDLLARQHFATVRSLLPRGTDGVALLTGTLPPPDARAARALLSSGEADFAIGTHALLSESTLLPKLGLCVVDEQHRFGVRERRALLAKARTPHALVLTATPIPRTLALLAFGDVDLSVVEQRPGGGGDVETRVVAPGRRSRALAWVRERLAQGDQAFFVRPRIGGGEQDGVVELHRELTRGPLAGASIGLVHGRLPAAEREEIVEGFRERRLAAVVATTVVEVGLDVPGATILWVEEPERLGLAQLHQLRGRIARRGQKGYCWLVPAPDAKPAARERLEALVQVRDGLRLAEIDLATRGPGELLGLRQSGRLGAFAGSHASIAGRLVDLVDRARRAAELLLEREPWSRGSPVSSSRSA
ncbi:MAG: helicase-related protein [bacterium]